MANLPVGRIKHEMSQQSFLAGVVEGFYGQSWTHGERLRLFEQMSALGLNTYFYAPKNDLKHRAIWRQEYSAAELAPLAELFTACNERGLNFIYGLSPGLDIHFSESAERERIKSRLAQMQSVGVQHFALLFDDLPGKMSDADRARYRSVAAAQCDVTNEINEWARRNSNGGGRFLFCPTPYCDRMDAAQLGGAGYLDDVGELLAPGIDVLWTGPEIVSLEIPVDSIERLTQRLRRRPVIWDNLFANDYDFSRAYCGPYAGRSRELRPAVGGILLNPNNEFPLNFVPLRTFAEYLSGEGTWEPREAFAKGLREWLPAYATANQPFTLEDLTLLADCFYLPDHEGAEGECIVRLAEHLFMTPAADWGDTFAEFEAVNARVQSMFDRLTELVDRDLFNAWSRRAWEFKEEMQVLAMVFAAKKAGYDMEQSGAWDRHLPGVFCRGFLTRLKRYVSIDATGTLRFPVK